MKPLLERNFVIVHLVVDETPTKKDRENPGAPEIREGLGGKTAGLPFFAAMDPKGKTLITSIGPDPKGNQSNTGYPAAPHEIAHFMKMLKVSAPRLTAAERTKIETWLKAHAPKQ